jgi:hypothetical protein
LKKAVILSVLLFVTLAFAMAFAGEKGCDPKACSAVCPMKGNAKAEAAPAAAKDGLTKTADQTKDTPVAQPATAEAPVKAETPNKVDEAAAPKTACETMHAAGSAPKQCKELTQFHAAMHPMALAIGFEGEGKKDYAAVRAAYPNVKTKTEALAKMSCDSTCTKDPKAFELKRSALVTAVDELGLACNGKDDAKIDPAFAKMHESYVNLATCCK